MTRPRPKSQHSKLMLGGQSWPTFSTLAGTVFKPMGSQCDKVMVSPSLGGIPIPSSSHISSSPEFVCPRSSGRGSSIPSSETGHRRSDMPLYPRILWARFRGSEIIRGSETGTESFQLEHLYLLNLRICMETPSCQGFRLHVGLGAGLHRPSRCLLSHLHTPEDRKFLRFVWR